MGLRILLCASEVVPFAKTGGLADVAGALPKALAALGHEVRVALPKYGSIDAEEIETEKAGARFAVPMGAQEVEVGIEVSRAIPGVTTYLVDSPEHFARDGLYGEPDDTERFALFSRAVLEMVRRGDWQPEVIHCNDWQTGLMPVYLRQVYRDDAVLKAIASLYTIHNLAYQGSFGPEELERIGLGRGLFTVDGLEFYGRANPMKGGLLYADVINTVSETYSREIQTTEYGEGLEGVLARRRGDLFGVLNGIDYEEWNPGTDALIEANYEAGRLGGKADCKTALQRRLGLAERAEAPVFGLVSRLAGQKGLDILAEVMPYVLEFDVQFALLGTGEQQYHDLLSELAAKEPNKVGLVLGFDNALAHQIYAGSDCFLMPSRYEPCGLGQMISLRYGTIPVVRETGGLADTIRDFDVKKGEGNGFVFREHAAIGLFGAMARAVMTMRVEGAWRKLAANAMACDFSWGRSAAAYAKLYQLAIERHGS